MAKKTRSSDPLQVIPGIGKSLAGDLRLLGIHQVKDLQGKDPQQLYDELCKLTRSHQDRCVLYTFRCAVYYAQTPNPDPELLKWWSWKDKKSS